MRTPSVQGINLGKNTAFKPSLKDLLEYEKTNNSKRSHDGF